MSASWTRAGQRAARRRSPWNFLLLPVLLISFVTIWWDILVNLVWLFHVQLYPEHEHQFHEYFGRAGLPPAVAILGFLMIFATFPGAAGAAMIVSNIIVWLIPPARRALDTEAKGYTGTSLRQALKGLTKFTAWSLGVGIAIALGAAACLPSL